MKKILENKIIWIISAIILLIIISITLFFIMKNKETKELKEKTYTMYISTNILSKITFKERYYECKKGKDTRICSEYKYKVLTHEYLDGTENNIELKDKDIIEVIKELYNKSIENTKEYNYIKLITNWDNKYSEREIKEKIESTKEVIIVKETTLDEQKIIEEETKQEEVKTYVIKFETDGGSIVNSQLIKENEIVNKPENPSKQGYIFKEWQLNGVSYDFNLPVTSEITLVAIWEKVESKPNQTTKPDNPSKPNTGNEGNTGSNPSGGSTGNKPTPEKKLVYVKDAEETKSCPSGYTLEKGECVKKTAQEKHYKCEKTEINGKCYRMFTETKNYTCNPGDKYVEWECHFDLPGDGCKYNFCKKASSNFSIMDTYQATLTIECNKGGTLINDLCLSETEYTKYFDTCPSGQTQECTGYVSPWVDKRECSCVERTTPTSTYSCGNLIMKENKCYKYE